MRDTDRDWAHIASENPYWGVLSDEQFRGRQLSPEMSSLFFESGKRFIDDVLGFVKHHIDDGFRPRRVMDFGCGVGRLLLPLARVSEEAVGVDIAPGMLEIAKQNLDSAGIKNASCILGDDSLSQIAGSFNFINSFIVLQHVPPERGMLLVRKLLSLLDIGGVFSLQIIYAKERRFFAHEQQSASFYRKEGKMITDLLPVRDASPEGAIVMFDYDLNEFMLTVSQISGTPLLIIPTNHDGHIGIHMIGRKARKIS